MKAHVASISAGSGVKSAVTSIRFPRGRTPTAVLSCRHNDVVHLEWPVLGPLDTREVRLLDRHGKPLPVPLQLEEKDADGSPRLVTDVPLAPLGRGDYLVELRVGSKTITDRKLIAVRVN